MNTSAGRYDRNIRLFGEEGQLKLRRTKVVIAGVSGLGSPLAQHMALLGIAHAALIDPKELGDVNRNRLIGARCDDPIPGSAKVKLVSRLIREINPDVEATPLQCGLISPEAFDAVKAADWVFGCFDEDGPRAVLAELCAAYAKPYVDLASDVPEPGAYGGRVCVANGDGCLRCLGLLDEEDVRRYLCNDVEQARIDAVYGIPRRMLGEIGPAVSPVNGVVASLAATEFMVAVTGMRAPTRLQEYRGQVSKVIVSTDPPSPDCYYCRTLWRAGAAAEVERYLKMPHLRKEL